MKADFTDTLGRAYVIQQHGRRSTGVVVRVTWPHLKRMREIAAEEQGGVKFHALGGFDAVTVYHHTSGRWLRATVQEMPRPLDGSPPFTILENFEELVRPPKLGDSEAERIAVEAGALTAVLAAQERAPRPAVTGSTRRRRWRVSFTRQPVTGKK